MKNIRTEVQGFTATIAFDHYQRRNALSKSLIEAYLEALADFKNADVRAVILRSSQAEKVWSAGHDVDELPKANLDPLPYDEPLERLLRAVTEFPAPVIAMVQGSAWGGACDLVMTCDMAFGDESCAFAITPAKLGLPYNAVGVLHFMNRLPLNLVMEMFCSAEPIAAERAARLGIINDLVPAADLERRVYALAELIARRSPAAISAFKATAHALAAARPIAPETFERIHGLRRRVYLGAAYSEGVQAFVEKRAPNF